MRFFHVFFMHLCQACALSSAPTTGTTAGGCATAPRDGRGGSVTCLPMTVRSPTVAGMAIVLLGTAGVNPAGRGTAAKPVRFFSELVYFSLLSRQLLTKVNGRPLPNQ